jgi:hypothetical protein
VVGFLGVVVDSGVVGVDEFVVSVGFVAVGVDKFVVFAEFIGVDGNKFWG